MIPKEQIDQIKKQLIDQIEKTFPPTQKEIAKKQILEMNNEQLIDFLKKNKMIKENPSEEKKEESSKKPVIQGEQCIFCAISKEEIPSYKIDENKNNIAVLEINPISKGHVIIIPKKHTESSSKLPSNSFSLAKKIAKKIKSKLKPKDVQIHSSNMFGHETLNVLPIYENESMNSQRYKEKNEELEKLKKKLEKKTSKKKTSKKKVQKENEKILIPRRIP